MSLNVDEPQDLSVAYVHLVPGAGFPDIAGCTPYKAVLILESATEPTWQHAASAWLVHSGCLYMLAWGTGCSAWDDSVDWANIEAFGFGEIPDERLVITTWHEGESLEDVFRYCKQHAVHHVTALQHVVLVHISDAARASEVKEMYLGA